MVRILVAASALAILTACAASPATSPVATPDTATVEPADLADRPFELAMSTVDGLVAAGNEQTAIDRITQLLGDPQLSDAEIASAHYKRGTLRFGDGNDVNGALADFDAVLASLGATNAMRQSATGQKDSARAEAEAITYMLENGDLSRTERFELMFRIGEHQDAIDYMLETGLEPGNAYLIDAYQMGYLCEGDEYGGPSYAATEPDGTTRTLQYCDFGK